MDVLPSLSKHSFFFCLFTVVKESDFILADLSSIIFFMATGHEL